MALPKLFDDSLELPLIAAPMFLTSGPELVIECCKAGVVGTFPALNQRSSEGFEDWLQTIKGSLAQYREAHPDKRVAPFGVNLIAHRSNARLEADLALCVKHEVPLIITSLGAVPELVEKVHGYGGIVFHDVISLRHARKAAGAGVDGLILVTAGAGGHAGKLNPFALLNEVRQFFDKTVLLSGCLSTGRDIATAQMMGADLAYMGTRFITTRESLAEPPNKQLLLESRAEDIVYTNRISGVNASFIAKSLVDNGFDPVQLTPDMPLAPEHKSEAGKKAWKAIWSAGQGVGSVNDVPHAAELIGELKAQYRAAVSAWKGASANYNH
ncbi:NAD(P)H-dependent flavin oxidoreductase [Marinobacterium rhizophilum]|uniref:Nitronate monooxygenase n=1 Tax=Marinobacterium rhizophilum TaxID=420402 RepID=A0ABY5HMF5_9GAMM|nr:nitronate monooxygenase family protein [Marinobacterium rhizophilum]UTW12410.1 nitronate monooxygenase [Marinobacterium rhizophilum]